MATLTLTDDEAATLKEVLEIYLSDLRMEISDTDRKDFRDGLKRTKELLTRLVGQLENSTVGA